MSWYAFHGYNNGKAIDASQFDGTELNTLGMHGYPTQAKAEANPNSVNVFQAPVVNAAIDDYNNARDISPTIANNPANPASAAKAAGNGAKKAAQAAGNAIPGLAAIGDFFARLTEGSTWIRAAEITLGVILLAVGVAKMTKAVPVATKIAGMVK